VPDAIQRWTRNGSYDPNVKPGTCGIHCFNFQQDSLTAEQKIFALTRIIENCIVFAKGGSNVAQIKRTSGST